MRASKKVFSLLVVLVAVCLIVCAVAMTVGAESTLITDAPLSAGREFKDGEGIQLGKDIDKMPRTYEAVVYVPSDVTEKGAIISNYHPLGATSHIDFAVVISGQEARPILDITDDQNNRTRVEFRKDIKLGTWVHIVITHVSNPAGDVYTCYVNGEKVERQNINYWINGTKDNEANLAYGNLSILKLEQSTSMYLGQSYGYSSTTELGPDDPYNEGDSYLPTNFKGRIKNVALYSSVLTEAQIKANYNSGIDAGRSDLIFCYDLTSKETSGETKSGYITDISGNGYNTVPLFHERVEELDANDFDYSFAVLGDTQFLIDWDVKNGTSYSADIYNWIIANKDSKKIARVLGVGDIVEAGRLDEGVTDPAARESAVAQWEYAVSQFATLEAAGIPYSITWGYNHDGYKGEEFTTYFGGSKNFTESDIGYYFDDESSENYNKRLANYYQRFEVEAKGKDGGTVKIKYLVMCIEYRSNSTVLNWADAVIKANPDSRVIISTHYFLNQYGEIATEYSELQNKWDKLANENANVEMILCGHVARQNNIVRAYTIAKSGQKVAQFLIDPQQMDRFYGYDDTGVVAMFYFSNEGNDIRVEFISTARTMRAKEDDPDAEDILYGRRNEFSYSLTDLSVPQEPEQPDIPVEPDVPDEPALGEVVTEYGIIPAEFSSATVYPFIIFDGESVSAAKSLYATVDGVSGALVQARDKMLPASSTAAGIQSARDKTVVILMRRDVTMSDESFWNLAHVWGNLVIDLGGYELTAPSTQNIFNLSHKSYTKNSKNYVFPTAITVKNGDIVTCGKSLIHFTGNATGVGKSYTCELVDVNVTVKGAQGSIFTAETAKGVTFDSSVIIKDCTFDITSSSAESFTLLNLGNDDISLSYTLLGGSVVSGGASLTFATKNPSAGCRGGVTLGASEATGKFVSLTLHKDASITNERLGKEGYYFKSVSVGDNTATYSLYMDIGSYGSISAEDSVYTFLVFNDAKSTPIGKSNTFYTDVTGAKSAFSIAKSELAKNRWVEVNGVYKYEGATAGSLPIGCTIVMIRDYQMAESETYSNIAQIQGTLVMDLCGNSFSAPKDRVMFPTSLKKWADSGDAEIFPSTITLKNGSINLYNKAVISYAVNTNGPGKEFNYSFENIEFSVLGSASNFIVDQPTSTASISYKTSITLTDCEINISGAKASNITLFNLGSSITNTNITVLGGNITVLGKSYTVSAKASGNGALSFAKSDNGAYTSVTLEKGANAPEASAFSASLCFVKTAETENTTTYALAPLSVNNYVPKMNITLESRLKVNVYIPVEGTLKFTFNGENYTNLESLERKTIGENEYYVLHASLPAASAANTVGLVASVDLEGCDAEVSFSFSIAKYAALVIADEGASDAEKTLIKAVLSYIKEAYAYFNNINLTAYDTLLEGYEANLTVEGETAVPTEGLVGATLVLEATPAIRFFLPEGADPADYTFKQGGRALETTVGTGVVDGKTYTTIDISVYAYRMCETVTYYINGVETGTYHINSYYAFAQNDANLKAIVEAFWSYCQSARAYKLAYQG